MYDGFAASILIPWLKFFIKNKLFCRSIFFFAGSNFLLLFRRSIFVWRHQFFISPCLKIMAVLRFFLLKKIFAPLLAPFLQKIKKKKLSLLRSLHFWGIAKKKLLACSIFFCWESVIYKINFIWPHGINRIPARSGSGVYRLHCILLLVYKILHLRFEVYEWYKNSTYISHLSRTCIHSTNLPEKSWNTSCY